MPVLMSYSKTWRQILEKTKFVTRRDGWWLGADGDLWQCADCKQRFRESEATAGCPRCGSHGYAYKVNEPRLKPGQLITPVQWSPRVGERWVCQECGWLGPLKEFFAGIDTRARLLGMHNHRAEFEFRHTAPERAPGVRHVSSRREPLSEITAREVELEGFEGRSPDWFRAWAFPGRALDHVVTRIEIEYPKEEADAP